MNEIRVFDIFRKHAGKGPMTEIECLEYERVRAIKDKYTEKIKAEIDLLVRRYAMEMLEEIKQEQIE